MNDLWDAKNGFHAVLTDKLYNLSGRIDRMKDARKRKKLEKLRTKAGAAASAADKKAAEAINTAINMERELDK